MRKPIDIAPAGGKLGILLVGLGAVSTTVIAGVHAIRKELAPPIGSLTELGTVRLGKRTERRSPRIRELFDLPALDDLVFGGGDIFEDGIQEWLSLCFKSPMHAPEHAQISQGRGTDHASGAGVLRLNHASSLLRQL